MILKKKEQANNYISVMLLVCYVMFNFTTLQVLNNRYPKLKPS